jgi:hypothetical protein
LFDWQIARFRSLEYFVDENGRATAHCNLICAIRYQRAAFKGLSRPYGQRQMARQGHLANAGAVLIGDTFTVDGHRLHSGCGLLQPNGGLQQQPGHGTALGYIKFEMENRFDVYLHDTPSKDLFNRDNRRISHGCIRVQQPRELAALLIQQPIETINQAIATGSTTRRDLPTHMPAFVVYQTAFVDSDGTLQFRPDVYNRDAEIWPYLHPVRQPVAEREPPGQRRS